MAEPFDWNAFQVFRDQLAAGNPQAAVEGLQELRRLHAEPAVATILADALAQLGDDAGAISCLQRDVADGIANHWTHYTLGHHLAGQGRTKEAAEAFRRSHALQGWHQSLERGYTFTHDYFSGNIANWHTFFDHQIRQSPIRILEIGSWQGGSTLWLLDHVIGPRGGQMTCVDTWAGSSEHHFLDTLQIGIEELFDRNIASNPHAAALVKRKGRSADVLPTLEPASFDFIFIDGAHEAKFVIQDALDAHRLLSPGGFLLFDDYHFSFADPSQNTAKAVDFFLACFHDDYTIRHKDAQVLLESTAPV